LTLKGPQGNYSSLKSFTQENRALLAFFFLNDVHSFEINTSVNEKALTG